MKRRWAALTLALLLSAQVVIGLASGDKASAATAFDPANIISDAEFFQRGAMSQSQIQVFLDAKIGSCLNSNCLSIKRVDSTARAADPMCGTFSGATAELTSTLIYRVQEACGVSAKVLLVMLQKEQGLVTHRSPTDSRLDRAMGYACPDNPEQPGWCDPQFGGLSNQIYRAAWQMKRYANPPGTSNFFTWYPVGQPSAVRYHPNASCGSSTVIIQNRATAALYYYTPYQPNAAALANPRGTGDTCSSYGNRNFWVFYGDWFGGSYVPPPGSPSLPTGLRVTSNTADQLKLQWSAPSSAGTSPVSDYIVSYTSIYHPNPVVVDDGVSTETTFTANNPTPGLTFTFHVQAKNDAGVGAAATVAATPPPLGAPSVPTALQVSVNNGAQLTLQWSAPSSAGASPVSDYVISYTSVYHPKPVVVDDGVSTETAFTANNPTPGLAFTFWVQAKNNSGAGGAATVEATPPLSAPAPSAPTALQVSVNNGAQLTLTWSPPSSTGSSPVSDYVISYTSVYHPKPVVVNDGISTETTFTANNPTPGLAFTFRVQARNSDGTGSAAVITVATPQQPSSSPPSAPTALQVSVNNGAQLTLTWSPPSTTGSSPVSDYVISYTSVYHPKPVVVNDGISTETTFTANNPTPGLAFTFRVQARNADRTGSAATVDATPPQASAPTAPLSLEASVSAGGAITLTWAVPASQGSFPITDYVVSYTSIYHRSPVVVNEGVSTMTEFVANNPTPGLTFVFRVQAKNLVGLGSPASVSVTRPR